MFKRFRRAIELDSSDPDSLDNLVLLPLQRGDADEAAGHLREAARLDPQYARFIQGG